MIIEKRKIENISPEPIINSLKNGKNIRIHNLIWVKDNEKIINISAIPNNNSSLINLYSLSKSIVSLGIGILVQKNLISINDSVAEILEIETKNKNYQELEIFHLLTMTVGQSDEQINKIWNFESWLNGFFCVGIDHKPGTIWKYNNFSTYILSAIIQKITGDKLDSFLYKNLFFKLGIENYYCDYSDENIGIGFSYLYLSADSLIKIGKLLLNNGKWRNEIIVNPKYLKHATNKLYNTKPISPEWDETGAGYGMHFWMNTYGGFRASGMMSQELIILPEYNSIVVILGAFCHSKIEASAYFTKPIIESCHNRKNNINNQIDELQSEILILKNSLKIETNNIQGRNCYGTLYYLNKPITRGKIFNIKTEIEALSFESIDSDKVNVLLKEKNYENLVTITLNGMPIINDYYYDIGGKIRNIQSYSTGYWLSSYVLFFEIRFIADNMWHVYKVKFIDNDTIEVFTYEDAREFSNDEMLNSIVYRGCVK